MVSPRAITSLPLARTRTRARPLLIFLLACFIAACLVTTASRSHKNERSRYLVSTEDTRELWPTPTAKDFDVLRSVPTHRPSRYANLRVVFEFAWYNGLTNMEYAAISSFILAKSMGAEVREGGRPPPPGAFRAGSRDHRRARRPRGTMGGRKGGETTGAAARIEAGPARRRVGGAFEPRLDGCRAHS